MDCAQAQDLMHLMLIDDPSVPAEERAAFDAHLETCRACREELEQSRRIMALVQEHGRLSPDTIELLESQGEAVPEHLRPDPEPEDVPCPQEEIEDGLAKLMAKIDEIEAKEAVEPEATPQGACMADLNRRVNTLEAYQAPWRKQWAEEEADAPLSTDRSMGDASFRLPTSWMHRFAGWRRPISAGLATAACLGLLAAVWLLWQPGAAKKTPHDAVQNYRYSVALVAGSGMTPVGLGKPIHSHDQVLELRLGGRHKVVLNRGTTATITAKPITGKDNPSWHVDLTEGELYAEVVPNPPGGARFAVATPNALATITGTKFNIRVRDDTTELTLLKGSVWFASENRNNAMNVTAGHASTVTGRAAPMQLRKVDARVVTAWARPGLAEAKTVQQAAGSGIIDPDLLADIEAEALVPQIPDYTTWSYERFRDEMRPWFAEQFPWAMELERVLNEDYGIEADYLDVLVISGDIWQFHYDETEQTDSHLPTFHPKNIERLAHWFNLDNMTLMRMNQCHRHNENHLGGKNISGVFTKPRLRWNSVPKTTTEYKVKKHPILLPLLASDYLYRTRSCVYIWIQKNPDSAERLLARDDYVSLFTSPLLPQHYFIPPLSLLNRLKDQLDSWRQSNRLIQPNVLQFKPDGGDSK